MRNELDSAHRRMRRQYGVATRRQLLAEEGVPASLIDAQLRSGRWEQVVPAIYRVSGGGVPPQQHLMVAVLRCGKGARLTGASVFALLSVEGFPLDAPAVVLMPRRRWIDSGGDFRIHRVPKPPRQDRAKVCGIPAVRPARALLDHARVTRGAALRVAVDAVRRAGLTSPQRLLDRALAAGNAHGACRVVAAVLSGTFRCESEGERKVAAVFYGVEPPLDFNAWLLPGIRVDAVWHDARLVLEYQSRKHHTLPTDREHDEARLAKLRAAGYEVVEIWAEDLRDPVGLRARVLALRASRLAG
ncbi:MAG: hypothetical protein ACRDU8_02650 [Egibacteraceae bacterium]